MLPCVPLLVFDRRPHDVPSRRLRLHLRSHLEERGERGLHLNALPLRLSRHCLPMPAHASFGRSGQRGERRAVESACEDEQLDTTRRISGVEARLERGEAVRDERLARLGQSDGAPTARGKPEDSFRREGGHRQRRWHAQSELCVARAGLLIPVVPDTTQSVVGREEKKVVGAAGRLDHVLGQQPPCTKQPSKSPSNAAHAAADDGATDTLAFASALTRCVELERRCVSTSVRASFGRTALPSAILDRLLP